MRVIPVPCLSDNYAYLLLGAGGAAVVVDPSEAGPVTEALEREGAVLKGILCTHHHPDHVGGNEELLRRFPGLPVWGHDSDRERGRIPGQTVGLRDGEERGLPALGARVLSLHVPGHTTGAVAYYLPDEGAVFTGDTLFGAGCGRLFEGTPEMMHRSLCQLAALPGETRIYFGHEYTRKNLDFAAAVEPGSPAVADRLRRVEGLRSEGQPSVPSTVEEERQTNPFLRAGAASVRRAAGGHGAQEGASDVEVFAAIRRWKDCF